MDELSQAIAYFEEAIRESGEIISECSHDLQKELTEQKRHFEVALGAMRRPVRENKPLTLDRLRQMDEEQVNTLTKTDAMNLLQDKPVKYELATVKLHRHMYFDVYEDVVEYENGTCRKLDWRYGLIWLAYVRKPEVRRPVSEVQEESFYLKRFLAKT